MDLGGELDTGSTVKVVCDPSVLLLLEVGIMGWTGIGMIGTQVAFTIGIFGSGGIG